VSERARATQPTKIDDVRDIIVPTGIFRVQPGGRLSDVGVADVGEADQAFTPATK